MRTWLALVAILLGSGCLESNVNLCSDDTICPGGTACRPVLGCVLDEQIDACVAHAEGDPCEFSGTDGTCQDGACVALTCGDGVVTAPEECDRDAIPEAFDDCTEHLFYDPAPVTCTPACRIDTSACTGSCGDGNLDADDEACDPGALPGPGDDVLGGRSCLDFGFYDELGLGCSDACTFVTASCTRSCGDGVLDASDGEDCDDGGTSDPGDDVFAGDCLDLGFYDATTIGCTAQCGFDASACTGYCGDREVEPGDEVCDGQAPPDQTCLDFGFESGALGCLALCAPVLGDCHRTRWTLDVSGTTVTLAGAWGSSLTDVFAVGVGGAILHWDGLAWSAMSSGVTDDLNAVWGSGPDDVIAVGANGRVLRWDGASWNVEDVGSAAFLRGVWGTGSDNLYVVGSGGTVRWWNGGSWKPIDLGVGTVPSLNGVWGSGPDDLVVVGTAGLVVRGSASVGWTATTVDTTGPLNSVWGSGPDDVYAVGIQAGTTIVGIVAHWNGVDWTVTSPTGSPLRAVWGSGPRDVFAVGQNGATLHSDGVVWQTVAAVTIATFNGVWGDGATAFATGTNGTIARWDGEAWSVEPAQTFRGLYAAWASADDDLFVGGDLPYVLHWDGVAWSQLDTGANTIWGMWGRGPDDVYAAGEYDILHYDGAWSEVALAPNPLRGVWGVGPDDVFAVGDAGTILHTSGGAWTEMTSGVTGFLWGVSGSAPDDVYAVGDAGTILHWDGAAWTALASGTTESLHGVYVAGPGDVYVVGAAGTILHGDGVAWTALRSGTTLDLIHVAGTGPADVFASGDLGTILHWDGFVWSPMMSLTTRPLYGLWAGHEVIATGLTGTIARRPRTCLDAEVLCGDGDDDDCDGRIDCADDDCAADAACLAGAACAGATPIACDTSVDGDTIGAPRRLDAYACDPWLEVGGEAIYTVTPTASGPVTATLTGLDDDLDLVVLAAGAGGGCDPYFPGCLGASSNATGDESVTFTAEAGVAYQLVVDGFGPGAGTFTLTVSCP